MANETMRSAGFDDEENPPVGKPRVGKYYLFVIAIDNYDVLDDNGNIIMNHSFPKLNNPVIDTNRIVDILLKRYRFHKPHSDNQKKLNGYPEEVIEYNAVETKCLYNKNANSKNIRDHLKVLVGDNGKLRPEDCLLIYFAGHGEKQGQNTYLIPYEAKKSDLGTYFNIEDFYKTTNLFKKESCLDFLLIVDACYSGGGSDGWKNGTSGDYWSRGLLSSAAAYEKAYDGDLGKGSPFAKALVFVLKHNEIKYASISEDDLEDAFARNYELQNISTADKSRQKIIYSPLPTNYGEGKFVFELKPEIAEAIPVQKLAASIVEHLNFKKPKAALDEKYGLLTEEDFHVISTTSHKFEAHQLSRSVMLKYLKNLDIPLALGRPTHIWPEGVEGHNIWLALSRSIASNTETTLGEYEALKNKIVGHYLDRLLRVDISDHEPEVICIGLNNINPEMVQILDKFCAEFYESLSNLKRQKQTEEPSVKFEKIFILIFDIQKGGISISDNTIFLSKSLIVAGKIDEEPFEAVDFIKWKRKAVDIHNIKKVEALNWEMLSSKFGNQFEILKLIDLIAQENNIKPFDLYEHLGIIKA